MMEQRCIRPWESSIAHVSSTDAEVDRACATQRVSDDVTTGYTTCSELPLFGEPMNRNTLQFDNLIFSLSLFSFCNEYFLNRRIIIPVKLL